jgi:hypothetical protein
MGTGRGETLMRSPRKFAVTILGFLVQYSSSASKPWGNAMLRELDFIESDWAALRWALGGATALLKSSFRAQLRSWLHVYLAESHAPDLKNISRRAATVLSGVIIAGSILTISVYGISRLISALSPQWQSGHALLAGWLPVLVVPEAVYVVTAAALWRHRRTLAAGVLLGAVALIVHVALYVATHG